MRCFFIFYLPNFSGLRGSFSSTAGLLETLSLCDSDEEVRLELLLSLLLFWLSSCEIRAPAENL